MLPKTGASDQELTDCCLAADKEDSTIIIKVGPSWSGSMYGFGSAAALVCFPCESRQKERSFWSFLMSL